MENLQGNYSTAVMSTLLAVYKDLVPNAEGKIRQVLARPPQYTTIRVRDASEDRKVIQDLMLSNDKTRTMVVECHPDIGDVVVIRSVQAVCEGPDKSLAEVVVDGRCGAAVLRGADIFVPGVLAASPWMVAGSAVDVFVDVETDAARKCRRGLTRRYDGRRVYVGSGVARVSRGEVFGGGAVSGVGVVMSRGVCGVAPSLTDLPRGVFLQNLPSVVCGHVVSPRPGDTVLDMCASPGGKTGHLAQLMSDRGVVVALDKSHRKVEVVRQNVTRLGLTCVRVFSCDATTACAPTAAAAADVDTGPPFPPATFDRILLDAPCSALGQRPQLINQSSAAQLASYPALQARLLDTAVTLLKPGGILVYSTCTLTTAENEQQVARALHTHPHLTLHPPPALTHLGLPGLPDCGLTDTQRHLVTRFDPILTPALDSVNNDTIGFFIARLIKRDGVES